MLPGLSPSVPAAPSFMNVARSLGLATNLQLCLDAGSIDSYPGSGQSFVDLSQNSTSFLLGANISVGADDPTFVGPPGACMGQYFQTDGGDFIEAAAATPWIDAFHADNATFTMIFWLYPTSLAATQVLMGNGNSDVTRGFQFLLSGANPWFIQRPASASNSHKVSSGVPVAVNTWNMIGLGMSEADGTSGATFFRNTTFASMSGTYTQPVNGVASYPLRLFTSLGSGSPMVAGGRLGGVLMWAGRKLTTGEITDFFNLTRGRFGV